MPSSTIHQFPLPSSTRSACPVAWIGWLISVSRWVRIGLRGHGSNGPHGELARATVTMWPYSVPPSEISR